MATVTTLSAHVVVPSPANAAALRALVHRLCTTCEVVYVTLWNQNHLAWVYGGHQWTLSRHGRLCVARGTYPGGGGAFGPPLLEFSGVCTRDEFDAFAARAAARTVPWHQLLQPLPTNVLHHTP